VKATQSQRTVGFVFFLTEQSESFGLPKKSDFAVFHRGSVNIAVIMKQ
jgi:hypothetical protein